MCKFTNRLFVFPLLLALMLVRASAVARRLRGAGKGGIIEERLSFLDLLPLTDYDYNYDLDYDQRQKGSDNMRLKMDGVLIALPAEDATADELWQELSEDLMQTFLKSHTSTASPFKSHLSYKSDALKPLKSNAAERKSESRVVVEIPAPKRDLESRIATAPKPDVESRGAAVGVVADANLEDHGSHALSPGKRHFYSLLNLMKRLRRH